MPRFLSFVCLLALFGCGDTKREVDCISPDGERIAAFYTESGGGAAGYAYEYVSVRPSTSEFSGGGKAFMMSHGYDTRLTWTGRRSLEIGYPDSATVMDSPSTLEDVRITIVPLPSRDGVLNDTLKGCMRQKSTR